MLKTDSETDVRWAWKALGLKPGATPEQVQAAWRTKAAQVHPDRGGTREDWDRLQAAVAALEALADLPPDDHPTGGGHALRSALSVLEGPRVPVLARSLGIAAGGIVAGVAVAGLLTPATEGAGATEMAVPIGVGAYVTTLGFGRAARAWVLPGRRKAVVTPPS